MRTILSTWTAEYERTHASVARLIAQESNIEVICKGDQFSNSSDFRILGVVAEILKKMPSRPDPILVGDCLERTSKKYGRSKQKMGQIMMPELPADSPEHLKDALDGGLLHEVFHSRYTLRGDPDAHKILKHILPEWDAEKLTKVKPLVKIFWNVFEDVMIERKGCLAFPGAPRLLQAVHLYVWEQETQARNPVGDSTWKIGQALGYLRDHCKSLVYLQNIPIYDETISKLFPDELIEDALLADNTYETLTVALKAVKILADYLDPEDPQDASKESEEESSEDESEDSQSTGESRGESEDESDGQDSDDQGENSSDSAEGDESDEGKNSDQAPFSIDDVEVDSIYDNLSDIVQNAAQHYQQQILQTGDRISRIIRPTHIKDLWQEVAPAGHAGSTLARLNREVTPILTNLRPPLLTLLANKDKMVRKGYQESGRGLSNRSLATVTSTNPRPFEMRYQEHAEKSCVLILLDLSGSMQSCIEIALAATLSVGHILQSLTIPFALIGFTSSILNPGPVTLPYTHHDYLIMSIAKDFHEPYSLRTQEKIASLQPNAATPLPDVIDQGVKILQTRSEKNKHLFIITDGAPAYASRVPIDVIHLLKKRLEAAQQSVKPFLLNVSGYDYTKDIPCAQMISKFDEMPKAFFDHLKTITSKK